MLIRAYFRIGRLMVRSSAKSTTKPIRIIAGRSYSSSTDIMSTAKYSEFVVRATMNDTPRRRAPVVMIPPAGSGSQSRGINNRWYLRRYGLRNESTRKSVAVAKRLSLPYLPLPVESGPAKLYYPTNYLIEPSGLCK